MSNHWKFRTVPGLDGFELDEQSLFSVAGVLLFIVGKTIEFSNTDCTKLERKLLQQVDYLARHAGTIATTVKEGKKAPFPS
eukprot:COSAG02_NODE_332_length_24474_cov_23.190949_3_plen_81_part_00